MKALETAGLRIEVYRSETISDAKLIAHVFNGPQIRSLLKYTNFVTQMIDIESQAWKVSKQLRNINKGSNYKKIVVQIVKAIQMLSWLMNLKVHFLDSHLGRFPENTGDYSK